jgi:hypothetical protein
MASVGAVASSVNGGENTRLAFFTAEPHVERMCVDRYGNVGIGTTNPSAQLTLGASSGSQIQVTDTTRLFSNTHYLDYGTDASATFEQVLLQFDTGGTGDTDQSEYAGYMDVEMVAQRTQSTYHIDAFTARLNFMLGWNEQSDFWQVKTFIQENTGRQDNYRSLESTPVFKYKYVDRQLQIYVSFDARQCRSYTSFTARVTSDNPADVSTPGADALVASGTVGTAEVGICYGVGTNAANVGIGTTSPGYTLDVAGTSNAATYYQNGVELYAQRRWEVDLTGQSTSNFYPVELKAPSYEGSPDLPDMFPVHFKVFGESLGGGSPYNESTLVGYARGGGWSDHKHMYDVHYKRYSGSEKRFEGLYRGTQDYGGGIVIYMRGGYRYSVLTDATEVNTYTSAQTLDNSVFAIKDVDGSDVSGTSTAIGRIVHIAGTDEAEKRFMSGNLQFDGNVGIGTTSPATKLHVEHYGSAIGDFEGIRIANHATNLHATSRPAYEFVVSDINSGTGIGHGKFAIGYRGTTSASRTDRLVIDNSGNVGIGTNSPEATLHIKDASNDAATNAAGAVTHATQKIQVQTSSSMSLYTGSISGGIHQQVANYNGGATYPLCLNPFGGNVGIGTTNPATTLQVDGSISSYKSSYTTNNSTWTTVHTLAHGEMSLVVWRSSSSQGQMHGSAVVQYFPGSTSVTQHTIYQSRTVLTMDSNTLQLKLKTTNGYNTNIDVSVLRML